ncbi:MAG: hypothetical protein EOM76_09210 [Sphingobacteriia bacterium]|nr:hypothetical protein [Sphingobacteriia bacterium]
MQWKKRHTEEFADGKAMVSTLRICVMTSRRTAIVIILNLVTLVGFAGAVGQFEKSDVGAATVGTMVVRYKKSTSGKQHECSNDQK